MEFEEDDDNGSLDMPPSKKRKRSKKKKDEPHFKKYPKDLLIIAADAVRAGASLHQTAKAYNIPFSTVRRFTLGGENINLIPDSEFLDDEISDENDKSEIGENENIHYDHVETFDSLHSYCFACLEQNDLAVPEKTNLQFFETFLQDNLHTLSVEDLRLCKKCIKLVKTIVNFKQTCSKSLKVLKEKFEPAPGYVSVKLEPTVTEDSTENDDHDYQANSFLSILKVSPLSSETFKPSNQDAQLLHLRKLKKLSLEINTRFCSVCCHFFPEMLENHYARIHGFENNGSWTCKCCSTEIGDKVAFLEHFDSEHVHFSETQKCPHCEETFDYREPYKMHVSTHNAEYECDYCHKRFYQVRIMRKHIETTHFGLKQCNLCRRAFATEEDYNKHMEEELEIRKKFTCEYCNKSFVDKQSMRKHQSSSKW